MAGFVEIDASVLDGDQIGMLVETGGEAAAELLGELIELYQAECMAKFEVLRTAAQTDDLQIMATCAHAIAGSSANIGGRLMWQTAKRLEENCKVNQSVVAKESLDILEQHYLRTLTALQDTLAKL